MKGDGRQEHDEERGGEQRNHEQNDAGRAAKTARIAPEHPDYPLDLQSGEHAFVNDATKRGGRRKRSDEHGEEFDEKPQNGPRHRNEPQQDADDHDGDDPDEDDPACEKAVTRTPTKVAELARQRGVHAPGRLLGPVVEIPEHDDLPDDGHAVHEAEDEGGLPPVLIRGKVVPRTTHVRVKCLGLRICHWRYQLFLGPVSRQKALDSLLYLIHLVALLGKHLCTRLGGTHGRQVVEGVHVIDVGRASRQRRAYHPPAGKDAR